MDMALWKKGIELCAACGMMWYFSVCNKTEQLDINIRQGIESYMEAFISMYMSEAVGGEQKIFIQSQDIDVDDFGYPVELTVYKNDNEEDIRYQVQLYGETGNSVTDYYLCADFIYVNQEKEYYSSQIQLENENDVLYRETNDWIILDDIVYVLRDDGEVQATDDYPFYSITEVNGWAEELEKAAARIDSID